LPGAWLVCFTAMTFIISFTGVFRFGIRCKKCGNTNITYKNVLNYPRNDRSILDVPYNSTKKIYMDDY
jgi:hypothetical protein